LIDKGDAIPYKILPPRALSGRNSVVECQLPKLDVAGSTPVARSKLLFPHTLVFKSFKPSSPVVRIDPTMLNGLNLFDAEWKAAEK
jgi:hypothetical protein